ncbi:MAG: peptidoglycan DD-metalloendopeptidase family protein [Bacteroidales bacterium]|jgi:septal ring factor EnvC (AmiA/AmiB activator)|nr:peptidoglycan DD-metalloendopeptidase family protein [Bacteroidales bacterium]
MKNHKFSRLLFLVAVLAVTLMLVPFDAFSQSKSAKLKNDKKKIETEIANTQKLLKQTEKNKNASLQQISVLRQQISNREALITTLNTEIFQLEEELALNVKLSQDLSKKLEYMKSDYSRVVYLAYKNRKLIDKVTFLLSSDNFSQMFRRIKYYSIFANNVKRQVELIEKTQEEIRLKNEEIVQMKAEKLALLEGKEVEIKKLEMDRTATTKKAQELKQKEKQLASALQEKQKKRKELDVAIKKAIEAEIVAANKKKAEEAAKAAKAKSNKNTSTASSSKTSSKNEIVLTPDEQLVSNSFANNKGKLPWPVAKGAKVGDFGSYPHPDVPSVMIENRGIDILVEPNTSVRAVFQGEVTGVLDVMGTKVLMIRHGEYLSVYQNLASVNVKKGDKVNTKQSVGTVARSSTNNTYELHFEVWKNNVYLNPNQWLSGR